MSAQTTNATSRPAIRFLNRHDLGMLGLLLLLCFSVAAVGGLVTRPAIDGWYATLTKPLWTPPNWLFAPVWSVLYVLMAFAAWVYWRSTAPGRRGWPWVVFFVQLALNLLWSVLFFGLRSPAMALVDVVLLWIAIAATAAGFLRSSRLAAGLMLPYLAWVSFAAILNAGLWAMN